MSADAAGADLFSPELKSKKEILSVRKGKLSNHT